MAEDCGNVSCRCNCGWRLLQRARLTLKSIGAQASVAAVQLSPSRQIRRFGSGDILTAKVTHRFKASQNLLHILQNRPRHLQGHCDSSTVKISMAATNTADVRSHDFVYCSSRFAYEFEIPSVRPELIATRRVRIPNRNIAPSHSRFQARTCCDKHSFLASACYSAHH